MDVFHQSYLYLLQGGWIMIPLVLSSVIMWALILERFYTFRSMSRDDITMERAIKAVQDGSEPVKGDGLRARLVRSFLILRAGQPDLDRQILRQSAMKIRPELSKFLAVIAVLAAIAPLLGLLGTVLGMIETFDVIALFGTGNAKAMAGGISIALVTTQTGLLVAIPGLFLSGMLSRKARQLTQHLDEMTFVLDRRIKYSQGSRGGKR
jgi:biopolymer transport protein ExbB